MYLYLLEFADYDYSPQYHLVHEKKFTREEFRDLVHGVILELLPAQVVEWTKFKERRIAKFEKDNLADLVEFVKDEPVEVYLSYFCRDVPALLCEKHGFKYPEWEARLTVNSHLDLLASAGVMANESPDDLVLLERVRKTLT